MRRLLLVILITGIGLLVYKLIVDRDAFTFEERTRNIKTEMAPKPIGPYNQAVRAGNTLYISGQIALSRGDNAFLLNSSVEEETRQVMFNIKSILDEAGLGFNNVVKTTIYVTDLKDFAAVNKVYGTYFDGNYPARETVQVDSLPKGARVEISAVAAN